MAKSVMIDNDIHENLLAIQTIIFRRKKVSVNLGDIVSKLIDKDPEEVAEEIIDIIESTNHKW